MYLIKMVKIWKAYNIVTKNKLFFYFRPYSHTKNNIKNKGLSQQTYAMIKYFLSIWD